uniref:Uncharacterized protein n=1 Tax=Arundo donax TaxID=35708 RepID=A0A0A9FQM5_ARUDO
MVLKLIIRYDLIASYVQDTILHSQDSTLIEWNNTGYLNGQVESSAANVQLSEQQQ